MPSLHLPAVSCNLTACLPRFGDPVLILQPHRAIAASIKAPLGAERCEDNAMDWELLSCLPARDRELLLSAAVPRRFAKNEVLFHEGDPGDTLHLMVEGRVAARSTLSTGESVTFSVIGPGEVVGEIALLGRSARRTLTVAALDPVITLALRGEVFANLRRRHPSVDRALIALLARRVERLSVRLLEALFLPADKRVVRQLAALVRPYQDRRSARAAVSIPLTQAEIASLAGTTRPTVNRVLRGLVEHGVVALGRGRIDILDLGRLAAHAQT
jgi:CRP-like cAMP-binding protein